MSISPEAGFLEPPPLVSISKFELWNRAPTLKSEIERRSSGKLSTRGTGSVGRFWVPSFRFHPVAGRHFGKLSYLTTERLRRAISQRTIERRSPRCGVRLSEILRPAKNNLGAKPPLDSKRLQSIVKRLLTRASAEDCFGFRPSVLNFRERWLQNALNRNLLNQNS